MKTYIKHYGPSRQNILVVLWGMFWKRKVLVISTFAILFFLPIAYLTTRYQSKTEAAWMDDAFSYRQTVAISNSGTATTNQYVKITLNTQALITTGKMLNTCNDIRITNAGGKILPHFIDGNASYTCNTTTTSIYVLADSIPASGTHVFLYYGNPIAQNVEPQLGSQQFPGISCRNILQHRTDNKGNGSYYITPTGNSADRIQVTCDMTYSSGGWILAWWGLPSEARYNDSTHESVNLSNNIVFNDIRAQGVNLNFNVVDTTLATAKLGATLRTYYNQVGTAPDTPNPSVSFHDLSGSQTVKLTNNYFLFGYGNSWRVFYTCINVAGIEYLYLGGYSPACTPRASFVSTDVGCNGGGNHYCSTPNVRLYTPKDSGLNLSLYEYQETKMYVRENTITLNINQSAGSPANEQKSLGPVAYWKFNEGYGGTTSNSTANTNLTGSLSGPTWVNEDQCINGKCLYYNALASQSTVISNNITAGWATNNDFTLSMWFNCKGEGYSAPPYSYLAGLFIHGTSAENGSGGFYLRQTSISCASVAFLVSTTTSHNAISTSLSSGQNNWSNLVAMKSGDTLYIYENGVLKNSQTFAGASWFVNPALETRIGSVHGRSIKGYIDEVKVYPYARTAAQIKSDFASKGSGSIKGTSVSMGTNAKNNDAFSNGLVGYWKMDEASWNGTSGEVVDASGNGNNGTANCGGTCSKPTTGSGKFGNGGVFDGVDDYVGISYTNPTTATSVVAWFKRLGVPAGGYHIITGGGNVEISINEGGGYIRTGVTTATQGRQVFNSGSGLVDGNWHQVAMTYDGVNLVSFIDGAQTASNPVSGSLSGIADEIGRYLSNSYAANGKIDEVRIYNKALSGKEIRDLYNWSAGPSLSFNFDEKTGTTANDSSGNGNNSNSWNNSPTWTNGKFGSAINFSGSSSWIGTATSTTLDNTRAFTVEAWINPNNTVSRMIASNAMDNFELQLASGSLYFYVRDGAGWGSPIVGGSISTGSWTHVVGVFNGSTISTYINGVLSGTPVARATTLVSGNFGLNVGSYGNGTGWFFNGKIDDVKFYNYARNSKQIVEDMNAGHPVGGSPVGSQVGYWKFDEGYGGTSYDSIRTKNGTLANGTSGVIPTWTANGKFGKSLTYSRTNKSYVNISGNNALCPTSISITGWFNRTETGYQHSLLGNWWNTWGEIYINTSNKLEWQWLESNSTTWHTLTTPLTVSNNAWHHFAVTADKATGLGYLYLDGVLQDTETAIVDLERGANCNYASIGMSGENEANNPYWFSGLIDEVKIYSSALTADEINLDYNHGSAMVLGDSVEDKSDDPIGYWKMDESSGNTAYNSGSSTGNATWSSTSTWVNGQINGAGNVSGQYLVHSTTGLSSTNGTVEAWVKPLTGTDNYWGIWQTHDSGSVNWTDWIWAGRYGSTFYFRMGNGTDCCSNDTTFDPTNYFPSDQWTHVAATWKGDADAVADDTMTVYVNGVQVAQRTNVNLQATMDPSARIGFGHTYTADGHMDEVKVYNHARSSTQIAADASTNVQNPSLPGAPVGEWKFDEGTGGSVNDTSGNNNLGTWYGSGTSHWKPGKIGWAGNFNGSDDYVNASNGTSLNFTTSDFTIELWTNVTDSGGTLIERGLSQTDGYSLMYDPYLHILTHQSGSYTYCRSATPVAQNTWQHWIVVKSSTGMKIYLNGKEDTPYSGGTCGSTNPITSTRNFTIGTGNTWGITTGKLDQVRVFNYARTPAQIAYDYNRGGPVGWWRFDECQGITANDSSGNGNSGTITIGATVPQSSVGTCTVVDTATAWYNGATGKYNSSLNFDGVDDWVSIGQVLPTAVTTPFTFSSWVNPASAGAGTWRTIVGTNTSFAEIAIGSNNRFACGQNGGGGFFDYSPASLTITNGSWYLVTCTYDGTYVRIYINGQLVTGPTSHTFTNASHGVTVLGRYQTGGGEWMNGQIDDVRVYNYALTSSQIKNLFNENSAVRFGPVTGSP